MKVDAFFEGGGILGISFIGAYKALSERGFQIDKVAGISAGSIIASLIATGFTANECIDIVNRYPNFLFFKQKTPISEKNYIGKPLSLLFKKGIYDSSVIEKFLDKLFIRKGISKFEDLIFQNESKLKILCTDFTKQQLLVIPDDLKEYEINPNTFHIAKAVRMSCAIPFFYTPVSLESPKKTHYIIDGGVIRTIPTTIINRDRNLHKLTFRFKIKGKHNKIINSLIDWKNSYYIDSENKRLEKTIIIPNHLNIKPTNFEISRQDVMNLYKIGYKATVRFIHDELYNYK